MNIKSHQDFAKWYNESKFDAWLLNYVALYWKNKLRICLCYEIVIDIVFLLSCASGFLVVVVEEEKQRNALPFMELDLLAPLFLVFASKKKTRVCVSECREGVQKSWFC